jgi:hypothetical protein
MLEIIGILILINRIDNISKRKGVDGCWYKSIAVLLWIVGEVIGIIIGVIITEGDESGICISYIFAMGGAIILSGILYLYINSFPDKAKEEEIIVLSSSSSSIEEPSTEWVCPKCKNKNPNTSFVCNNCGFRV